MSDVILLAALIAFFVAAALVVRVCDRLTADAADVDAAVDAHGGDIAAGDADVPSKGVA